MIFFVCDSNFFLMFSFPEDLLLEETLNQLTIELQVCETLD